MDQHIKGDQAYKAIGITKQKYAQLDKSYHERFGGPLPVPQNHLGHRLFSPAWIVWVREVYKLRQQGAAWLEVLYECKPFQPAAELVKAPAPSAREFAYEL